MLSAVLVFVRLCLWIFGSLGCLVFGFLGLWAFGLEMAKMAFFRDLLKKRPSTVPKGASAVPKQMGKKMSFGGCLAFVAVE